MPGRAGGQLLPRDVNAGVRLSHCPWLAGTWFAVASNKSPNPVNVVTAATSSVHVKVRITETPREDELDGVRLDSMKRGTVREVSPSIGAWLIAEGYAVTEMRHEPQQEEEYFFGAKDARATTTDSPRRRSGDR